MTRAWAKPMNAAAPASEREASRYPAVEIIIAAVLSLAGLVLSIVMALASDGVHHDDDLVHHQMARWSFEYPQYLLHEWGRPGFTVLYAIPAQFGWTTARIFSGVLTAATGWLAFLIARRQGISLAALTPLLFWLQPMTFTLSYTTLTEPVLAFYLTLAMWLLISHRMAASAIAVSLTMLTRHEAALFLALWAVEMWRRRARWWQFALLLWAPLAHNVLSALFLWSAPLLMFLEPQPTTQYGSGAWYSMLARWMLACGIGPVILACLGAFSTVRRNGGWLWIGCGIAYLAAHSLLYRFGLFATGGYYRFLVAIGPIVAVAAADGLSNWLAAARNAIGCDHLKLADARRGLLITGVSVAFFALLVDWELPHWLDWLRAWARAGTGALIAGCVVAAGGTYLRSRIARGGAAALLPLSLIFLSVWQPILGRGMRPPYTQAAPLRLTKDQFIIRDACTWIRANGLADRPVVSANGWVNEYLQRSQSPFRPEPKFALERMNVGDLFVWDANYAPAPPHNIPLESLTMRRDLLERWRDESIYCVVFERVPAGNADEPRH
ncbi:MAG: hypothetical protein JNG88_11410 [Phycisphaerales bacterium]|nr:hypothetical protein [Phycisphaerales bacterium]